MHSRGQEVARWTYRDYAGRPVGHVSRFESNGHKRVLPFFTPDGKTFKGGIPDGWLRTLFGRETIERGYTLAIAEGEKSAAAFHALHWPAVTSLGGCKSAAKSDWCPTLDAGRIFIFPDNDQPGIDYALQVAQIISPLPKCPEILVCKLPGLPKGGDIVDWLQQQSELEGWDGYDPTPVIKHAFVLNKKLGDAIL